MAAVFRTLTAMAMQRGKTKNRRARPFLGARPVLLLCAAVLGALIGAPAAEYLLSFRRNALPIRAAAVSAAAQASYPAGRMDVNIATARDFMRASGVGPALAQAIVDYRDSVGGFFFLEELLDVPGVGDARFAALKELFFCPVK